MTPTAATTAEHPNVISMSRDQLLALRQRLLDGTGMDYQTLDERAQHWALYPEHRAAYETIRSIDWLLEG